MIFKKTFKNHKSTYTVHIALDLQKNTRTITRRTGSNQINLRNPYVLPSVILVMVQDIP